MGETTPQTRARVYDKARSTIAAKLAAIDPPPPAAVADRQRRTLEDAIATVERGYARPAAAAVSDPLAELEDIFSSIDRNKNQPSHVRPQARPEPAWQPPKPDASTRARERVAPTLGTPAPSLPVEASLAGAALAPAREEAKPAARFEEFSAFPGAEPNAEAPAEPYPQPARRSRTGLIAAAVALLVVAAGGYGVWLNAGAFGSLFGGGAESAAVEPLAQTKPAPAAETAPATPAESDETPKFTQRLTAEGKETDPGPAGGDRGVGEGTSIVALTTPPSSPPVTAPAETNAPAPEAATPPAEATSPAEGTTTPAATAVAVGQKAIFYEERTNAAQGSAEPGSIVWSLVQESPGGDAPPEPAIRAEVTIPGKDVQLRMTIRRNKDETLPASHIIELIFLTPDGFEGGGIDNILRMAMKSSEQDAGSPLIGIPAKIADGFFLVALNDTKADEQANLTLLRDQDWIDIPVIYKSGRRALLTMEKGIPGEKVFDDALKAWQDKPTE